MDTSCTWQTDEYEPGTIQSMTFHSSTWTNRMVHAWLWKYQNKAKLLALLDQNLPAEDAQKIRPCQWRWIQWVKVTMTLNSNKKNSFFDDGMLFFLINETNETCHWQQWAKHPTSLIEVVTHWLRRKALEDHVAFRENFGGRVFTADAVQKNLKVSDEQPWVGCALS